MEMMLLIVLLGSLGVLLFGRRGKSRWTLALLGLSLASVILQLGAEGYRWQMVPAYSILILLPFFIFRKPGQSRVSASRWLLAGKSFGFLLYAAAAVFLPLLIPVFSFAPPTGPYAVGTTLYHWVDSDRYEEYTGEPRDYRELMVQLWYPAGQDVQGTAVPYVDHPQAIAAGLQKALSLPAFALEHLGEIQTHAYPNASLAPDRPSWPVLVFSHGLTGFRNQNTYQLEELASHGYIVAAIDHTYDAAATVFPDGRTALAKYQMDEETSLQDEHMRLWENDIRFVLEQLQQLNLQDQENRFAGALDMKRIGLFGHSYGGAAAFQLLMKDERVKAAINMDGILYGSAAPEQGIGKPFLLMNAENSVDYGLFVSSLETATRQSGLSRQSYEDFWQESVQRRHNATAGGGYSLTLPHTDHMSYTDLHLYSALLQPKGEEPRLVHRMVNEFGLAFFD
ncbi:alpha/beta hydrolase family protein [Paenibacillus albidus]|nr:dienelactone hydrolase family protein [Paenibacillus albidus]